MDKKEKLLQKRVAGLFALLCVIFFQFFDSDHLFLKEEVVSVASLPEVLVGYWGKPAWLACSMAKVLTSLFVPVGGGAVLIKPRHPREPFYLYLYITTKYIQNNNQRKNRIQMIIRTTIGSPLHNNRKQSIQRSHIPYIEHWVYWALLLITGTVLPEFLKELYSLSEEQAYQYPQAWLPAFFPAIMLACVLVATQFKKVRYMQISVWSVSVTSGLLLVLLALTAFSHAVG